MYFNWSGSEAVGVSVEAVALIAIFYLDYKEHKEARLERAEQRKVREEERQERAELRQERQRLEEDRQRSEVICVGLRVFAPSTEDQLCDVAWRNWANKQAGFGVDEQAYNQLPEYLQKKAKQYPHDFGRPLSYGNRSLIVFKFPSGDHTVILRDLRPLENLGDMLIAWDEDGKPMLGLFA